ncbi:MAG: head GIN domain-containing protein [Polyangiales bacterium]
MFTLLSNYRRPTPIPKLPVSAKPWCLVMCAVLMSACGSRHVDGSGTALEEVRPLTPEVTHVSVHGEGLLVVTQGSDTSLRIRADDNIVPLLRSEIVAGVLTLGPEDGVSPDSENALVYGLTLPRIESVETSGATRAQIGPVEGPHFELRTSGASQARAESITAERVAFVSTGASSIDSALEAAAANVSLSGSSRIELRGRTNEQEVEASGASEYRGRTLRSHRAEVRASGSSACELFADESIRVDGTGASNVRYQGGGQVSRSLSGAASVDVLPEQGSDPL